jgi:hypothetical protein
MRNYLHKAIITQVFCFWAVRVLPHKNKGEIHHGKIRSIAMCLVRFAA